MKLDWVVCLDSDNPFDNLSQEECILDGIKPHEGGLMLYINRPCMVLGKNQNPWWELDLDHLDSLEIPVLRRISGGGTVFHDQGNINYSFILPRQGFSKETNLRFLSDFFRDLGLDVAISEKGDLLLGGKKISGNALCFRKNHALHHGTLLFSSNQALLAECLAPSPWRALIRNSAHVNSRPMETANISPSIPDMSIQDFVSKLGNYAAMHASCQHGMRTLHAGDAPGWQEIKKRHQDWEWIYGKSPAFSLDLDEDGLYLIQSGRFVSDWAKNSERGVLGIPLPLTFDLEVLRKLAKAEGMKIMPKSQYE